MSIHGLAKNDYSFLFSSLGSSGSSSPNLNFISEYASIKNGSYGKLMKAYYAKDETSKSTSKTTTQKQNTIAATTTANLSAVQTTSDKLKDSADALLVKGEKSLFKDESVSDTVYNAVSKFVSDYNSVIKASKEASNTNVGDRTTTMVQTTKANQSLLSKIGITVNQDNTLALDKTSFMASDFSTVKGLFNTTGGFAYRTSAQASLINYAADNAVSKASSIYTTNGTFNKNYSTGSLFDSLF